MHCNVHHAPEVSSTNENEVRTLFVLAFLSLTVLRCRLRSNSFHTAPPSELTPHAGAASGFGFYPGYNVRARRRLSSRS